MDLQSYVPARNQHGLLTHQQALATGLTPREIERLVSGGTWVRLRKGVYTDADAYAALEQFRVAPMLRMRAVALATEGEPIFTHDSAAIIQQMGAPSPRDCPVHIARTRRRATRTNGGIQTHGAPFLRSDVHRVEGLLVLSPTRTALDMTRLHGLWPGVAACDAALRLGSGRADLAAAAAWMQGWPYRRTIDQAITYADAGAESYLESLARGLVIELGIGRPETQFGVRDGKLRAWCDIRVDRHIFEADGLLKYVDDAGAALRAEKQRQDFLSGLKLGVSRITYHDCFAGRRDALRRLAREYDDTCRRFGTSIEDLAPYVIPRSERVRAG